MTIIRIFGRSVILVKNSFNNFPRHASILAVNHCINHQNIFVEKFHREKIPSTLQGQFYRNKFKKSKQKDDDDTEFESELDTDDRIHDKHTKTLKVTVNSLRLDLIIKQGLGIARNKVEALFYESKIRVNGNKVDKKSVRVDVGDEIDVIKGVSQVNPDHLVVQRVEILDVKPKDDEDGLVINLRRNKSLIIENYENPYKGGSDDN